MTTEQKYWINVFDKLGKIAVWFWLLTLIIKACNK